MMMRSLFGCLLCLVLTCTQSFAVPGGPQYGGSQVRTTGIYAGVLRPGPLSPGANSIGLFSMTIPRTGLGTGIVVLFTAGQTYNGTITGIADPDSAKLFGEIDASFPYTTCCDGEGAPFDVEATAAGKVEGKIKSNKNVLSSASARIVGTANVQYSLTVNNPFTQIGYKVRGFKQSEVQ